MKVSLSVLTVDYANVEASLNGVLDAVDYVHLDVMDGNFVPNISFGPSFIKSLRKTSKTVFDTHLMISNPLDYVKAFRDAGSDMITFHYEANGDTRAIIEAIRASGAKVGISIKPNTKVEALTPYLPYLDLVLVMSVEPGFGGQSFLANSLDKISFLAEYRKANKLNYLISVDGGINNTTGKLVKEAGVDFAVVGSFILNNQDKTARLAEIKHI